MVLFLTLILIFYFFLLLSLLLGFKRVPTFSEKPIKEPIPFSVIIPFRNEAEKLPELLESFQSLDYPKEFITFYFVDDDSTDESVTLIDSFKKEYVQVIILQNIRTTNSPKKDAIRTAIKQINTDWIITVDADCIVPSNWLSAYANYIQEHDVSMIIGEVTYTQHKKLFEDFQLIDFLSLQLTTIGSFGIGQPILCNGANLAYTKKAFLDVNGFEGNDTIASGDDVFLLEKISAKTPKAIGLLKSSTIKVITYPETSVRGLIQQRLRWAGKSSAAKSLFTKLMGFVVLVSNLSFLVVLGLSIMYTCYILLLFLLLKIILDISFFIVISKFYKQYVAPINIFISAIIYPFFSSYIGIMSMFSKYKWKGRIFNQ